MHFLHEDEANTTCSLWQSLSLSCTQTDIYYTHTRALSLTYTSTMNEGNRPVFIWRRKKEDTAGREFVGVFANIIIRWWGMLWGRYTRGGLYNQRRRFELWIGVCGAGNACTLGWIVWMWMTWRRRRRGSSSLLLHRQQTLVDWWRWWWQWSRQIHFLSCWRSLSLSHSCNVVVDDDDDDGDESP